VGQDVVEAAEESAVGGIGAASQGPGHIVVDVTPPGGTVATLPGAMTVAGDDRPSQCSGNDPGTPPHVDDLAVGAEDDPAHRGVAGKGAERGDGENMPVLGLMLTAGDACQGLDIADDVDVWLFSAHGGGVPMVEEVPGQVFESVMTPLSCGAVVTSGWGWHQSVECGTERG
jgi:hypothetical protein